MAQSDSVMQWLRDLRDETEVECMCVLQGKSLTKESADLVFVVPKSTKGELNEKQENLNAILDRYISSIWESNDSFRKFA